MVLLANFLLGIAKVLNAVLLIYMWIVILRAVLSWINVPTLYPVTVVLHRLTEPVLRPLRKIIPPSKVGGIDITPIIVILILMFVNTVFVKSLFIYAKQMLGGYRRYF